MSDRLIQRILHEEMSGVAIIAIAHRIETLAGYDAIYELAGGRIVRCTVPRADANEKPRETRTNAEDLYCVSSMYPKPETPAASRTLTMPSQ